MSRGGKLHDRRRSACQGLDGDGTMASMRAAWFDHPGDPSVLQVQDVPDPGPPSGDRLLVRVAASSVNGTDLGLRRGAPGAAVFGRHLRLGFDVVGEVVGTGPEVTAFAPGDRVAALLPHSGGGQAEQVSVRQGRAARPECRWRA